MPGFDDRFATPTATIEHRADGSAIVRNAAALNPSSHSVIERLDHWAGCAGDRTFLTEIAGEGRRRETYASFARLTRLAATSLREAGLGRGDRVAMIAENGIDHAIWVHGAMRAGVVPAILSPALLRSEEGHERLAAMLAKIEARRVITDHMADMEPHVPAGVPLQELDVPAGGALFDEPVRPQPDDVAKILFTSGSTGTNKAVPNTHGMMASNMEALEVVWPLLRARPPELVDWLPWSHTFGGNCCFNLALWNGGTFHIDHGRPVPGAIATTWAAIKELRPSVYFNVPVGYAMLAAEMETDPEGAVKFLSGVDFLFNAGAALPASVRARLEAIGREATGHAPPIIGAWGATETAPFSTVIYFDSPHAGQLGLPLPGTDIKMVPREGVCELRVRGPNVFSHYLGDPEASLDAFDAEGFYRIGDAGYLADPEDPAQGLVFDGRVAENFKLSSGTWVNVGALRVTLVSALADHVRDLVVLGEGRSEIAVLLFARDGVTPDAATDRAVAAVLAGHNAEQLGSSSRVARFAWAKSPPVPGREITDKGYINQRAVVRGRADEVQAAYSAGTGVPVLVL